LQLILFCEVTQVQCICDTWQTSAVHRACVQW